MRVFVLWLALVAPARSLPSELLRRENVPVNTGWKDNGDGDGGQSVLPDFVDKLLWGGVDLPDLTSRMLVNDSFSTRKSTDARTSGKIPLQILGLYDTGTNLISRLMEINFKDIIECKEYVWKHTNVGKLHNASDISKVFSHDQVLTIAMVRNPLSWLQALRQKPFEMDKCVKNNPLWLNTRCQVPGGHTTLPIATGEVEYPTVQDYWNSNVRDYSSLGSLGFPKFAVVQYEDLVLNTESVMKRIASTLELPALDKVETIMATVNHGLNHDAAIQNIKDKTYVSLYNGDEINVACHHLDGGLLAKYKYSDCPEAVR